MPDILPVTRYSKKLTGIKGAFRTRIAYVVRTNGGQFPYELRVSDYDGYNQFPGSPFITAADVAGMVSGRF